MRSTSTLGSQRGGFNMGCLLAVILVIVAAGVGIFFLAKAGLDVLSEQIKLDIRDNPVIREHIGEIQEIELNLKASGATAQQERAVFRIRGSKGSGELTAKVETDEKAAEKADGTPFAKVISGSLRMSTGETYDLFPAAAKPEDPKPEDPKPEDPQPEAPAGG